MALFGDGGIHRREPRSLVEFRAGKMKLNGTTVTPDTRKGLVFMKLEDNLMHFCWKDRKSGKLEDDFIVFPGDAEIKQISQCTTGRVLLLKFKDTNRKCFYWLQEPNEEKDEEYLKKVNDLIDNPASAATLSSGGGDLGRQRFPIMASQLQSLLQGTGGDISQQQLIELLSSSGALGGGGGLSSLESLIGGRTSGRSHTETSTGAESPSPSSVRSQPPERPPLDQIPRLQLTDLQNALATLQVPPNTEKEESENDHVSIRDVVTSDVLRPLAREEEFQTLVGPHLPLTNEETQNVLTSPQFQQAMSTFSSALGSGQLGPLVSEFGLGVDVASAANTGNTMKFAEAMEKEMKDDDKTGLEGEVEKEKEEEEKIEDEPNKDDV